MPWNAGVNHGFILCSCLAPAYGLRISKGEQAIAEMVSKLHAAYAKAGSKV